ncbi:inositol monophosphatase 3-like [Mizuhopecten yessoensis]|uniref:inositol-phosphate phosphatase n=1 Tax=Mizuhopecten yessoensis TaxID=6573 RepID=A0A210Q8K3_MIZYE|nr:inositol monophosphatase 3-like [Mizuhopecten yessoensis]OWF45045.1 Inositol monophosphatase 3 [Mizuhopecten yessoensis]
MGPANIKLNPIGAAMFLAVALCLIIYAFGVPKWFNREPTVSMKELLTASIELARRGGTKVKDIRLKNILEEKVKGKTAEGADEMLTQGDSESNRAIVYGMSKAFSGIEIISEETDLKPVNFKTIEDVSKKLEEVNNIIKDDEMVPKKDITVWVDPLDATKEYTENLQKYVTVMICVAVKGSPKIGVIYKPFLQQIAWAWVGYGHSENLKNVQKSPSDGKVKLPKKIIVSRSHSGPVEKIAKQAYGNDTQIIPAGGAGYKTLEVISGNADAYVHTTLIKKWDICAGNAVLSALNGKMTTLEGDTIDYKAGGDVKNHDGLLVTSAVNDHYEFLSKLSKVAEEAKKSATSKH